MSAIDFVVRGSAGVSERGSVGGSGGASIILGSGQDLSLNLSQGDILSYVRQGQALQIALIDGQMITIEGFFGADGVAQNELFISSNGGLAQVDLTAGEGNLIYAQYVEADSFGKWSPDDDLYFVQGSDVQVAGVQVPDAEAGMLAVPILGGLGGIGLGLAGAGLGVAALAAGAGAGGSDSQEDQLAVAITEGVQSAGHTVDVEDYSDGITISGTGTPGASGVITVSGVAQDVTVDDSGNWTVEFTPEQLPGGEYEADISVTLTDGDQTATATDVLVVDTIANVSVEVETVEADGVVNAAEESDGFTLTGATEEGSSVVVTINGQEYDATVTGSDWALDVPAGTIEGGEYDLEVTVTATDAHGNTASTVDVVHIDTITSLTLDTSAAGGDGTVNQSEHSAGVVVNGVAEGGASVEVNFGGAIQTVQADADGNWSATFASADVPTGELEVPVTAISTDAAGNTATASGSVQVDTELSVTVEANGVVNAVEHADGVTLTGTSAGADTVQVTLGDVTHTATVAADGSWSVDFADGEFATGEVNIPVTVQASDAAGNTDAAQSSLTVDTFVNRLESAPSMVEGDDVVNSAEAADGITLNGVVEVGSTVMVTFQGTTRAATVDANGNWSVSFDASEIPGGTYEANVTIDATDAAGNTASISDTFSVDTDAPDAANIESVTTADNVTRGFSMVNVEDGTSVDVSEYVNTGGNASDVAGGSFVNPINNELQHNFDEGAEVPDGSHLVVTTGDASGNTNSTLLVLDEDGASVVNMDAAALTEFNIGAIDLEYAEDSELTLNIAELEALSGNDNSLVIHGGIDDHVTLNGIAQMTGTREIDGQNYNVFSVGDNGGELIINQDIDFNQNVV